MFDTVLLRPILSAFNVNVIPLCFLSFLQEYVIFCIHTLKHNPLALH